VVALIADNAAISLRTQLRPGDIGAIIELHGVLYAREYGWDHTFEAYVAETISRFALDHDERHERIWMVEHEGRIAGCVGIVRAADDHAQLRWFLLSPAVRGRGLGRKLLDNAVAFSRMAGYRSIFLWTVQELSAAGHLYRAAGFTKTAEERHERFGALITEERYDLDLQPGGISAG
jgi:N-acetylglutamate synthase-like GNAT family acetyltransferase